MRKDFDRAASKKKNINTIQNNSFYILMFIIPITINIIISASTSFGKNPNELNILSIFTAAIITVGMAKIRFYQPTSDKKSAVLTLFGNDSLDDFKDALLLSLLKAFYIFCWSLLLFVPGIIKGYAYSQSTYIFFEKKHNGQRITYNEAITESRQLMSNRKFELFVLQLSLIGWGLLSMITVGIADIFIVPYVGLIYYDFYKFVKQQHRMTTQKIKI